jgi:hypothetical protein
VAAPKQRTPARRPFPVAANTRTAAASAGCRSVRGLRRCVRRGHRPSGHLAVRTPGRIQVPPGRSGHRTWRWLASTATAGRAWSDRSAAGDRMSPACSGMPQRPRRTVPPGRPEPPAWCGRMAGQRSGLRPPPQPSTGHGHSRRPPADAADTCMLRHRATAAVGPNSRATPPWTPAGTRKRRACQRAAFCRGSRQPRGCRAAPQAAQRRNAVVRSVRPWRLRLCRPDPEVAASRGFTLVT